MPEYRKNLILIKARKDAGLTRREVAEGIGIGYMSYDGYETGRLYPSKQVQEKICDFFHCRGIYLEEDDAFPEEMRELANNAPKNQKCREIVCLPPSSIRFLSDHNPVDMPPYHEIETQVADRELSERTRNVLASLTPRQEKVLRMRYGIGEICEHTLEEIGRDFDVTMEYIRQVEAMSLRKLRYRNGANKLKPFLETEE